MSASLEDLKDHRGEKSMWLLGINNDVMASNQSNRQLTMNIDFEQDLVPEWGEEHQCSASHVQIVKMDVFC